ncbi:MAG: GldG family protein [Bacteriovoracaceae bacterium]|nr:GldG family protein [Bacteriovoracaceae bacterium]
MKRWMSFVLYSVNIILYLLLVGLLIAIPEELTLNLSLAAFSVSLSLFVGHLDRERYLEFYRSGMFNKFAAASISVFLVFCIFGMLNYVAFKNAKLLDLSYLKLNSLTEKSESIIKGIDGKVKFIVFSRKAERRLLSPIIDLYQFAKNDLEVEYVDVEIDPIMVSRYQITSTPQVVVEYKGRREYVINNSELNYTNALIKIGRKDNPIIYFTTGHGELSLDDLKATGVSKLKKGLLKSSYSVKTIDLKTVEKMPKDMSALVILGARSGFSEHELKLLSNQLYKKGKILIAIDPDVRGDKVAGLRKMFKMHGVHIRNNLVIDTISNISGSNGTVPLIKRFSKDHIISQELSSPVFFPLVASVEKSKKYTGSMISLMKTNSFPSSWAEESLIEVLAGKVTYNEGTDRKGPISVGAVFETVTKLGSRGKIVAFGNSTFVRNQYAKYTGNFVLFANAISWLSNDGQLSSFNLPFGEETPVFISGPQLGVIFYVVVIFIPLLLFGMALFWYRRRRRL